MKTQTKKTVATAVGISAVAVTLGLFARVDGDIETKYRYERVVRDAYVRALERDPGFAYEADPGAMAYEDSMAMFYENRGESPRPLSASGVLDELVGSDEYRAKNPLADPPVCEELPECAGSGGTWDPEACDCACPDFDVFVDGEGCAAPLPPPDGPEPNDYVNMDRVDDIINGTSSQNPGLLHGLTFGGWRDPLFVASKCSDAVSYIGFEDQFDLEDFGNFGLVLASEGEDFIVPQLRRVNRRCNANHPEHDSRYCGRSEMRKTRLVEYRGTEEEPRLSAHMDRANHARVLAGRCRNALGVNGGFGFDSIAGWCGSLRQAGQETGFTVEDCP